MSPDERRQHEGEVTGSARWQDRQGGPRCGSARCEFVGNRGQKGGIQETAAVQPGAVATHHGLASYGGLVVLRCH